MTSATRCRWRHALKQRVIPVASGSAAGARAARPDTYRRTAV